MTSTEARASRLPKGDLERIVAAAEGDLRAFRGQSIFVTGGTGFIGSWMTDAFLFADDMLSLGLRLRLITRNPDRFAVLYPHLAGDSRVTVVAGDVRTLDHDGNSYDTVIHGATDASARLNAENPLLMSDTIVEGTRRTLEFARRAGASGVLMMSSGGVYGKFRAGITHIREDDEGGPDPMDPYYTYSESKRMAELLCAIHAKQFGMHVPVARIFALVGPRLPLDAHFAAGNFIRDALAGGPIRVAGDGTAVRSYLYAADLVVWLLRVLVRGRSGRAYNVGSDHAVSIRALAEAVAAASGDSPAIEIAGNPGASNPVNYYVPDVSRARDELDLDILTPLDEALARTLAWNRSGKL